MKATIKTISLAAAAMIAAGLGCASTAGAAEGGTSFYLLGLRGPMAGFTPPPGVYVQNDLYYYQGSAQKTISFDLGGRLIADLDASAVINLTTLLWVTPVDVAGGNLAFTATVPIGGPDITGTLGRGGRSVSDSVTTLGDPILGSFIGWHEGDFHWQVGTSVNVPIGDYQEGEIANLSFHHWAADLYTSGTWLNPNTGFELSGAMGITFNGEDNATDYKNGTEFHFEGAAIQHFSKAFDAGLVGYYYDQISPDKGDGVPKVLGGFEGRVAAIGATIGYTFQAGEVPIMTRVKYYHEFDAKNRLEGDSVFLTLTMPLAVAGH
ncbi:phenol degradation protein meta [Rhizobium rhizosphaerae]|uniref:Phenol degradation protein meta n=1 Tax=Xaviernesmea rhizosphaerae TaxID=1672749 RepID=A0ABX3PAI5_9HYPH|nr:transporter [Xaviernesmea rhizosphaerae]OQP84804.1 phenol degradation protein meta [Xaviernesmea rhizosphaerae]